jgi:hypothetical protein
MGIAETNITLYEDFEANVGWLIIHEIYQYILKA